MTIAQAVDNCARAYFAENEMPSTMIQMDYLRPLGVFHSDALYFVMHLFSTVLLVVVIFKCRQNPETDALECHGISLSKSHIIKNINNNL